MNIGQSIYDLFGGNGEIGILLCIFLIFLLDALVIPTPTSPSCSDASS